MLLKSILEVTLKKCSSHHCSSFSDFANYFTFKI